MKRKILSVALCLSMLVSLVAFAPFSFAVDTSEPFTMSEQNNNDASKDQSSEEQTAPQTDSSVADPQNQPAEAPDANVPSDSQQGAENQEAEPAKPAPEANAPAEDGKQEPVPPAVNFTDVGPFLPAVNVGKAAKAVASVASSAQMSAGMLLMSAPKAALAEVTPEPANPEGLKLDKTVKPNDKGGYTLTLDAYTTGTVSTSEKKVPVDIVIVMDQSGSMDDPMDGSSFFPLGKPTRQEALKKAVKNFIDGVNRKYSAEADHRISLVEFKGIGSGGSTPYSKVIKGWTKVDDIGKRELNTEIDGMDAKGGTYTDLGMKDAENLMNPSVDYTTNDVSNNERQKVVILFTDGMPGGGDYVDIDISDRSIASSYKLKNELGCTVYSIGIFDGADPSVVKDQTQNWWYKNTISANRFMNYISSNFKFATDIGLSYSWPVYKITHNFDRDKSGYYLSANNAADLNNIFQNIVENIVTPSIQLGSETVIKDIIADSFELPKGADKDNIRLYTADATATTLKDGKFAARKPVDAASGITASVSGNTVNVTGFDFNKNFVSENPKPDKTYGKKLIIEIDVKLKDGFLGGNNVPTNGVASGIYPNKDSVDAVGRFPVPTVDIPVANKISVNPQDKNIYLLGDLTDKDFTEDKKVTFTGAGFDGKSWDELADWQKKYVDLNVTLENGVANDITSDREYTVNAVLSAKANPKLKTEASGKAKINVFRPEVTYKDIHKFYGEVAPDANALLTEATASDVKWTHGEKVADSVTMIGTAPTIDRTAVLTTPDHVKDGVYVTADDSYYKVTTKIGNTDIAGFVVNKHQNCDSKCDFDMGKGQFAVHKDTCTLNITKKVTGIGDGSFTMKVDGKSKAGFDPFEILVKDGQTVTLEGLPIGAYTVTEDADWAWKYTAGGDNGKPVELTAANAKGSVTITNTPKDDKWLNFVTSVQNLFTGKKTN